MDRVAILLNPSAGRGNAGKQQSYLEDRLKWFGINYKPFVSRSEEDLRRLAAENSHIYSVIVGAGGDGTLNIILNELMHQRFKGKFGIVSLGSQNDIAREFGVDSLEEACSAIQSGRTMQVDLGILTADNSDPLYFLGTASLGLGTTVPKYVEEWMQKYPRIARAELTKLFGFIGIHKSFSTKKVPIPLTLNDGSEHVEGNFSLVVFNNTSYYAGGIIPSPDAKPNDGLLDCCYIEIDSFSKFLYFCYLASIGRLGHIPEVKRMQSNKFRILSKRGVEIQTDGKVRGSYREINLAVISQALRVIVNPSYSK